MCEPEPLVSRCVQSSIRVEEGLLHIDWNGACDNETREITSETVVAQCQGVVHTHRLSVGINFSLSQPRSLHEEAAPAPRLVHSENGGFALLVNATTVAYKWQNSTWTLAEADRRVEVGWGVGLLEVQVLTGHDRSDYWLDSATATLLPEQAKGVWWVGSVAVVMGAFRAVEILSFDSQTAATDCTTHTNCSLGTAVPFTLYDSGHGCSNVPHTAEWLGLQLEVDDSQWLRDFATQLCRDERTTVVVPTTRTLLGVALVEFY